MRLWIWPWNYRWQQMGICQFRTSCPCTALALIIDRFPHTSASPSLIFFFHVRATMTGSREATNRKFIKRMCNMQHHCRVHCKARCTLATKSTELATVSTATSCRIQVVADLSPKPATKSTVSATVDFVAGVYRVLGITATSQLHSYTKDYFEVDNNHNHKDNPRDNSPWVD